MTDSERHNAPPHEGLNPAWVHFGLILLIVAGTVLAIQFFQGDLQKADRYFHGASGCQRNVPHAMDLYERACEDEQATACMRLGAIYEGGHETVEADDRRARTFYEKACEAGNAEACNRAAYLAIEGGALPRDVDRVVAMLREACAEDVMAACYNLGHIQEKYRSRHGRARKLYTKACNADHARACNNLGFMEERARGGKGSAQAAARYYEKSCEMGEPAACFNLAKLYEQGRGVDKKPEQATKLFQKACEKEHRAACARIQNSSR